MNIAADLKQIVVFIHQHGLVALLKDMARAPVTFIEIDRVAGLERLHQLGEISFGCLQKKMDMIGQKTVTEKLDSLLLAVNREPFQVSLSVLIVPKNSLAVVASANNVIDGSRIFHPSGAGHAE